MKTAYFSTFQLILLALLAALIVVAKIALRLPLQMPGHSGIFWMAIVIVAAGVVPRRGAASLVGLTSGLHGGLPGHGRLWRAGHLALLHAGRGGHRPGAAAAGQARRISLVAGLPGISATWASSWSSGAWARSAARRWALWPSAWPRRWSAT